MFQKKFTNWLEHKPGGDHVLWNKPGTERQTPNDLTCKGNLKKEKSEVVHSRNPSCSHGTAQENQVWRPAQAKGYWDPILISNLGMEVHICGPNYTET
jgi:hypothetical protein